ncbi:ABC-2 family transporter protein [Deinococcus sp.]|uniref:ABC-2 family transporter protein n=1 Tax=Deinococcus sp. TaxID=47478 RepID=UPI0025BDC65E|nr:ABC-2 family transporter protein [Deinococcus sp.]
MCLLYGLAELAFVLMDILFGGFDVPNLSGHVRSGTLSTFLLRPAPLTLQVFASDFALCRVARVVLAAAIAGYGLTHAGLSLNAVTALLLLSSVLGMIAFFGALFVVGGTLTFWTVDSVEAMNVLTYGGRTLISYPMDIYSRALRRTFTFIIPAGCLSSFPVLRVMIIDHGQLLFDGQLNDLQARYGGARQVQMDFEIPPADPHTPGLDLLGAGDVRAVYAFHGPAAAPIALITAHAPIRDLTVREPDIDSTIRRIYEEGLLRPPHEMRPVP